MTEVFTVLLIDLGIEFIHDGANRFDQCFGVRISHLLLIIRQHINKLVKAPLGRLMLFRQFSAKALFGAIV